MKPGDTIEAAVWLTGAETAERLTQIDADLAEVFRRTEKEYKVLIGPIAVVTRYPGGARVPPVPGHITGPDVRLLVAETSVLCRAPVWRPRRFVEDLDAKDLTRLRTITRRQALAAGKPMLTDDQCDAIIEELGPEAAGEAVRQAVDGRVLH